MRMRKHVALGLSLLGVGVLGLAGAATQGTGQRATQAPARKSTGPDYQVTARQIVQDSVQVKEREGVLITGDASKIPLMEAIAVEVAKQGAFPHMVLESQNVTKRIMTEAPMEYLETPNAMTIAEFKKADVMIALSSNQDPTNLAKVPEERMALVRKAGQAVTDIMYSRPLRTVALGNPTMPSAATARFYGVPLAEMEARFWQAVNTPHAVIEENSQRVKGALASGNEVRIRSQEGTDLRFNLADEKGVHVSDGQIHSQPVERPEQVWLPAGEVYTVPEATSVNGTVFVPLAEYRGIKIRDLRLTFVNGKVTKIEAAQNAEALKQALAQSSGDKDVFSFLDIGVNPNSRMIGNSNYCTFEMAGMVTIGIGQAPWAPGCTNQSEFEQEFFIPRATLEVDGRPIVKDGKIAV
jgi:aminopeptidase